MSRTHKYVKRTGTPGNYRYFYKMPDGSIREGDPDQQKAGQNEHARRLIAGRASGHHTMSTADMARHTGLTARRIGEHISNMRQRGRRAVIEPGALDHAHYGHDFSEHHMAEAQHAPDHPDYARHVAAGHPTLGETPAESSRAASAEASRRRAARARASRPSAPAPAAEARDPHGRTDAERESDQARGRAARAARAEAPAAAPAAPAAPSAADRARALREKLAREHGVNLGDQAGAASPSRSPEARAADTPPASRRPAGSRAAHRELDSELSGHIQTALNGRQVLMTRIPALHAKAKELAQGGMSMQEAARKAVEEFAEPTAAERARRAKEAVARQERPGGAAHPAAVAAVSEVDPAFAADEAPIREMVAAQARGENPYLNRAKDIYNRINADLKPERKEIVRNALGALAEVKERGGDFLSTYKRISGNNRATMNSVGSEFEKGTYHTLEECLENKPIDVEVERMKRGYGAKQFARMKPFIKASWLAANSSAPPPYPTFGDVKSWGDHGGPKPSWAGSTRLAMPKEVFDAAPKKDGKPQYPPAWMPVHMMPVWNYIVKKAGDENPYQTVNPIRQGEVQAGNQAGYQEGIAINALRKYVQMRGANKLVDIPHSKLAEMGLAHHDIFKSGKELDDEQLKKLCAHKIIDPVSLQPFMEEAIKESMKKSFALVVDLRAEPVQFRKSKTSYVISEMKKSLVSKSKADYIRSLIARKSGR